MGEETTLEPYKGKVMLIVEGNVIERFGSSTEPKELEKDIEKYILK